MLIVLVFVFKQKTAYEVRISDWSSDVCSSDLHAPDQVGTGLGQAGGRPAAEGVADEDGGLAQHLLAHRGGVGDVVAERSAQRRVGKECVSTCRSRWTPSHSKKK